MYVDESFPAAARSLYYGGGAGAGGHGAEPAGAAARWLRPHQIHVDADPRLPWVVFRDPRPSDISQGEGGGGGCMNENNVSPIGFFICNLKVQNVTHITIYLN